MGNKKAELILRRLKLLVDFAKEENDGLMHEIARLPEGSLQIKRNHRWMNCYVKEKNILKCISKKDAKARALARKAIAIHDMKDMDEIESVLREAINAIEFICSTDRPRAGKVTVKRIPEVFKETDCNLTYYERKWLSKQKKAKELYPEQLKYRTKRGLLVRSKSEMIIAEQLDELGILYVYEPRITINGRTMIPDFVILRADKEIIIWEHFGLLNDPIYRQNAMEKIELYKKMGYYQHTNLICTEENDIRESNVIRKIIEERLMV